jgi:hypothetical protein
MSTRLFISIGQGLKRKQQYKSRSHICDYVTFSNLPTNYAVLTVSCSSLYYFNFNIIQKYYLKQII